MTGKQIYFLCITILACLNFVFLFLIERFGTKLQPIVYGTVISKNVKHIRGLNVHIWYGLCLREVLKLRGHPTFPRAPLLRKTIDRSQNSLPFRDFGQRLFGFLHPNITGDYQFEIINGSSAEVWLSLNEKWQDSQLIAQSVGSSRRKTAQRARSRKIKLLARKKYFIDIYHVKSETRDSNFKLVWKQPGNNANYEIIRANFVSFYLNETEEIRPWRYFNRIPDSVSRKRQRKRTSKTNQHFVWKSTLYSSSEAVSNILPPCNYKPSYLVREKLRAQWAAIYSHWHPVRSYPFVHLKNVSRSRNHFLSRKKAEQIVAFYLKVLSLKSPRYEKFH